MFTRVVGYRFLGVEETGILIAGILYLFSQPIAVTLVFSWALVLTAVHHVMLVMHRLFICFVLLHLTLLEYLAFQAK